MKQVIIDRGIYHLGMQYANGESKDPEWVSTCEGRSIVIGHEDEKFNISSIEDIEFILKELNTRLKLNITLEKFTCDDCEFEFYSDTQNKEVPDTCPYCCSNNITRIDFIEDNEVIE